MFEHESLISMFNVWFKAEDIKAEMDIMHGYQYYPHSMMCAPSY